MRLSTVSWCYFNSPAVSKQLWNVTTYSCSTLRRLYFIFCRLIIVRHDSYLTALSSHCATFRALFTHHTGRDLNLNHQSKATFDAVIHVAKYKCHLCAVNTDREKENSELQVQTDEVPRCSSKLHPRTLNVTQRKGDTPYKCTPALTNSLRTRIIWL